MGESIPILKQKDMIIEFICITQLLVIKVIRNEIFFDYKPFTGEDSLIFEQILLSDLKNNLYTESPNESNYEIYTAKVKLIYDKYKSYEESLETEGDTRFE